MANNHEHDQWLQDVEARQRNIVFPDTVQNEARFWHNLSKRPLHTSTKIGLAFLAVMGLGGLRPPIFCDDSVKGNVAARAVNAIGLGATLRRYRMGNSSQSPQHSERSA